MTVFFTSDQHFGHGGARGLFRRPFAATCEMDRVMIERWNAVVSMDDIVWHLGDLALYNDLTKTTDVLTKLNGHKHLIAGNNDTDAVRSLSVWQSVQDYKELELDGTRLVLCHYPLRAWNDQYKGALQLHGHSHGRLKPQTRQVDVGVDSWDFTPITLAQIKNARGVPRAAKARQVRKARRPTKAVEK